MKKGFNEMNRPLGRCWYIVLVFGLLFTFSCAPRFPDKSFIADDPAFDLLIGVRPSEYKEQLITRLVDRYKPQGNIDLVGISTLENLECEAYDAVLLMDACRAWSFFNFSVKSFLQKSGNCNNVIVFMTAGDPDWKYQYNGLDAVTSASIVGEQDRVFTELSGQIDQLIVLRNKDGH